MQGKRIVIIGGSSGMGLATARMAAEEGASVVIASRHQEKLDAARAEIGGEVQAMKLDVTDKAAVKEFFEQVGEFDHLTTPASEARLGLFLTLSTGDARATFDTKFWGQYNAARYGAPKIREGGSIVMFAGVYSQRPPAGAAPMAAINGAIEALGRALAVELSPIRVNVVSPGLIDTPVWDRLGQKQKSEMFEEAARTLPARRAGKPEYIARTVLYLMSNPFATGSTLYVDGGYTLR